MAARTHHDIILDAIRGLSAQVVVVGHAASVIFQPSTVNAALAACAHVAVWVFFGLSGYVIVGGLMREMRMAGRVDFVDFTIRRSARIMPPYLFTIGFVFWFFLFTDTGRSLADGYEVSMASALRSSVFAFTGRDAIVLTPVWSLRLEVGLYIFAALGTAIFLSHRPLRYLLVTFFVGLMALFIWRLSFAITSIVTFGFGAMLAIWGVSVPKNTSSQFTRLAAKTGDYSYTIYLSHMPVIYIMSASVGDRTSAFILSVLSANLLAFVAAVVVERPAYYAAILRRLRVRSAIQPG